MKWIGIVVIVAMCLLAISCEVSLWRECRVGHSFIYCWRVLG